MSSSYPVPGQGEVAPPPIPPYELFNFHSVALATILGTPMAGCILMAVNYRRLGKGGQAAATIGIGLLVTAAAMGIGYVMPQGVAGLLALALLFGTRAVAKSLQGFEVEEHVRQGGKLGSKWAAAGIGLGLLALFVGGFMLVYSAMHPKVMIGSKDEVYYSGSATKEDARKLGDALKTMGFLTDRGVSASVAKDQRGTVVSFTVKEEAWKDPRMVANFEEIGRQAAPSVGGFPIRVLLLNSDGDIKQDMTVGKAIIGTKDEIYYLGQATEGEAKALGQALQKAGFFHDAGYTVVLAKGDGTAVSFVVKDGLWDQPENIAPFEKIVRDAAGAVGGLPLKLRLLNRNLEIKKEVAVE